jgi:hypothetical protein
VKVVGRMDTRQPALRRATRDHDASAMENQIDQVVLKLHALARKAGLSFAISAGRLIVESFYGGAIDSWREKGIKNVSFRRLARRPDLPMSATSLYRCVAIYDLYIRLPALSEWRHVTVSHARAVLPLSMGMQETMLERAEEKRWSVATLEAEVNALRPIHSRRPRSDTPPVVKMLHRLRLALDDERSTATLATANASSFGDVQLLDTLQRIRTRCEELESRIRSLQPNSENARPLAPCSISEEVVSEEVLVRHEVPETAHLRRAAPQVHMPMQMKRCV